MYDLIALTIASTMSISPVGHISATPAQALSAVKKEFGETPFLNMTTSRGAKLVMTRNSKTGSWSVFLLREPGVMCLRDGGRESQVTLGIPA